MGEDQKKKILEKLGGMKESRQSKYLGLPLVIGRTKNQVFDFIREKVTKRLYGWKEKLQSQAVKEILPKFVILALPAYSMPIPKLPKGLCKNICREMANFWWGQKEEKQKRHLIRREKLSKSKGVGGLGFRDLMELNQALLTKQLWRLLTKPNSLVRS